MNMMLNQLDSNQIDSSRIKVEEDCIEIDSEMEDENIVIMLGADQIYNTKHIGYLSGDQNSYSSQLNKNVMTCISSNLFIINCPMIEIYDLSKKKTEWNNLKSLITNNNLIFTLFLDENWLRQPIILLNQYLQNQYLSLENSISDLHLLFETKTLSIIVSDVKSQSLMNNLTKTTRQELVQIRENIFRIYWSERQDEQTRGYRSFLYYLSEAFSSIESYLKLKLESLNITPKGFINLLQSQEKIHESQVTIKPPKELEDQLLKKAIINLPYEQFDQLPQLFTQLAQITDRNETQQVYNERVSQFHNRISQIMNQIQTNQKVYSQEYLSLLNEVKIIQHFESSLKDLRFDDIINTQALVLQIRILLQNNLVSPNAELGEKDSLEILRKFSEQDKQFKELEEELRELIDYRKVLQTPLPGSVKYRQEGDLEIYLYPRYTENDFNQIEKENLKVIMVVGQTGSGKSTMLDALANYLAGIEFDFPFRYKLVDEQSNNQAQSITQDVKSYYIKSRNSNFCSILVVDTPGFMDTSGIQKDKKTVDKIEQYFKSTLDQIHCVCLVSPSSSARLTASQKYVFDKVLQIFGRDIEENIVNLFTFCDGGKPQVLHAIVSDKIPHKYWYKFNNSALFVKSQNSGQNENFEQMCWLMGVTSMKHFFEDLNNKFSPRSLKLTKEVLDERKRLEHTVANIQPRIDSCLSKLEQARRQIELLEHYREDKRLNEKFEITDTIQKVEKIALKPGINTTTCRECNRTCHDNCHYKDDNQKAECVSMQNEYCTVCPRKCHWSSHSNLPYKFEYKEQKVVRTSEELKKKYVNAKSKESETDQIIKGLSDDHQNIRQQIYNDIQTLQKSLKRLGEIALRPYPYSSKELLDQMVKNEEYNKKPGYPQRIKSLNELIKEIQLFSNLTTQEGEKVMEQVFKDHKSTVERLTKKNNLSISSKI